MKSPKKWSIMKAQSSRIHPMYTRQWKKYKKLRKKFYSQNRISDESSSINTNSQPKRILKISRKNVSSRR